MIWVKLDSKYHKTKSTKDYNNEQLNDLSNENDPIEITIKKFKIILALWICLAWSESQFKKKNWDWFKKLNDW